MGPAPMLLRAEEKRLVAMMLASSSEAGGLMKFITELAIMGAQPLHQSTGVSSGDM